MTTDNRLTWKQYNGAVDWEALNEDGVELGHLVYERVGGHMHWCWYQLEDIRMSPGCLQEVRDKQKQLFNDLKLKSKHRTH